MMFDDSEVMGNLDNVIGNLLPNAIKRGLEDAITAIETTAKQNAPVDDGHLRASITSKVQHNQAVCGTNLEYSVYVHEGTGIYAKDGNGRKNVPWRYQAANGQWYSTVGQRPNPFLQNAIDTNMGTIASHFKGALK